MKRYILLFLTLITLASCKRYDITGTWIQPIPGMESQYHGITFNPDGTAESVNMHTLQYQGWEQKDNYLTVYGLSIRNGQTGHFYEVYEIKTLTKDKLFLWNENVPQEYTRAK